MILIGSSTAASAKEYSMKINIKIGKNVFEATLLDTPTSRDFISQLPLKIKLEDYNRTEIISYLHKKLTTENSPKGVEPKVGDISYYAPWGNLAIFYRDFKYSPGLIKLGVVTSNLDALMLSVETEAIITTANSE
jgi:hypothetical protein